MALCCLNFCSVIPREQRFSFVHSVIKWHSLHINMEILNVAGKFHMSGLFEARSTNAGYNPSAVFCSCLAPFCYVEV